MSVRYWTREEILGLMEALADVNATVRVSAWRCHDGKQPFGHSRDWTGPYRYEMYARFPGGMSAKAVTELAEVVRMHGAEMTLWESCDESGSFHIHPPSEHQFDEVVRR